MRLSRALLALHQSGHALLIQRVTGGALVELYDDGEVVAEGRGDTLGRAVMECLAAWDKHVTTTLNAASHGGLRWGVEEGEA